MEFSSGDVPTILLRSYNQFSRWKRLAEICDEYLLVSWNLIDLVREYFIAD